MLSVCLAEQTLTDADCFVDKLWYEWQMKHPNASYPDGVLAQNEDSDGIFDGIEEIENISGWQREGRTPCPTFESSSAPSTRLIMILKNIQTPIDLEIVEVQCLGQTIARVHSLSKDRPMQMFSDFRVDVTEVYQQKFANVSIELLATPGTCNFVEYDAHTKIKTESTQPRLQIRFNWTE